MSDDKIRDKREQFLVHKKSKLPVIIGVVVVLAVAFILLNTFLSKKDTEANVGGGPVAASRSYVGKVVQMTPIQPVVENGLIKLNLADVDQSNIVGFEMKNDEGLLVPMMAYISSSGQLFVGASVCECGGHTFSLAGKTLVCNTCRTTYDIENQAFISGANICREYPPINMNATVENGMILLDQSKVLNWRIREGK